MASAALPLEREKADGDKVVQSKRSYRIAFFFEPVFRDDDLSDGCDFRFQRRPACLLIVIEGETLPFL